MMSGLYVSPLKSHTGRPVILSEGRLGRPQSKDLRLFFGPYFASPSRGSHARHQLLSIVTDEDVPPAGKFQG
jgi:hypothetical protein